jgi:hypothetical protein
MEEDSDSKYELVNVLMECLVLFDEEIIQKKTKKNKDVNRLDFQLRAILALSAAFLINNWEDSNDMQSPLDNPDFPNVDHAIQILREELNEYLNKGGARKLIDAQQRLNFSVSVLSD